jgi:hypothetical protein
MNEVDADILAARELERKAAHASHAKAEQREGR